jgi:cytochrome c oxidase accessory protein FixG
MSSSSTLIEVPPPPVAKGKPKPLPPPAPFYRRLRKSIHAVCFLVFVVLPFFDLMRFDLPKQRFFFFGNELWISEFAILLFSMMFLLFAIVAMTLLYGRVYCGYLCPQNIFSEAADELKDRIRRLVTKKFIEFPQARRKWMERILFWAVLAPASVFLAFIFTAYFVEPRDLWNRLATLDVATAGGISGLSVTILTFLDFAFLRHTFCTTVCPYGFLQSMLVDQDSLLVHYREPDPAHKSCIECKKCVRVCYMNIDIRVSPHQMECIHCGECIDACDEILARVGKPGLIHYAWGEEGATLRHGDPAAEPWYKKIGLRDPKRIVTLVVIVFYFAGLMFYLGQRHAIYVRVNPERSQSLYKLDPSGEVRNEFRVRAANRSRQDGTIDLEVQGLNGARIESRHIAIRAGEELEYPFAIHAPRNGELVQHFTLRATARPELTTEDFDLTFLRPQKEQNQP